jgi:hypothetical protein
MNPQITFPKIESADENGSVSFPVVINGRRAGCRITVEAFQDRFGLRDANSLPAFKASRTAIENLVTKKIREDANAPIYLITT